ncbi:MAG: SPOR domain-containing protein [Desulfobacterales bacterium]|jgi:cell division septation protein DedD|nr:SPOR domain-containing protein [Desulfobacterales bacterium]
MQKAALILFCLLAVGCIQNTYHIAPEFQGNGAVNIDSRVDADDPRVSVTVDDVTMDWKDLKELVEKRMAGMPKETKEKTLLSAASAPAPLPVPKVDPPVAEASFRMTHSVQVGAYRQLENAEQQVTRLAAKGYPARMIRFEDSRKRAWYTVRIGDYPDAAAARTAADEFAYRERMPSAVRPIGSL